MGSLCSTPSPDQDDVAPSAWPDEFALSPGVRLDHIPVWDGSLSSFSSAELHASTDGWSAANFLGKGGFGEVYKGGMRNAEGEEIVVAVKRLNSDDVHSFYEWLAEVRTLGGLRHPHLVVLIGYTHGAIEERALVYEYMPNMSLDTHLFSKDLDVVRRLGWYKRVKIAVGAAMALDFLHSQGNIHRDFKVANILLDMNFEAKVADFGLAKEVGDQSHVTTNIRGTLGYLDPAYSLSGQLTKKSDVFSFGVVLLELITGKAAIGMDSAKRLINLTTWTKPFLKAKKLADLETILDRRLEETCPWRVARVLAITAHHCVQPDKNLRPVMGLVVESLKPLVAVMEEMQNTSYNYR